MRFKLSSAPGLAWFCAAAVLFALGSASSSGAGGTEGEKAVSKGRGPGEGNLKIEAQLIWGTNDAESPDPKHKPVDEDILRKLRGLPLKWRNFFCVNRKTFEVPVSATGAVALSEKCRVEVKNLGGGKVDVAMFGNGQQVHHCTIPRGEVLVVAGNAPNDTAWLVVLKRVE